MKYCANCGTQMSDEAVVCPQCHPEFNNQQFKTSSPKDFPKKKSNKIVLLLTINIILSTLTLVAIIIMHFMPFSVNRPASNNNSNSENITSNNFNSTCPADNYGNHDWAPARCTEPAQCYNCDAYRDDKLGEHSFYTHENGLCDCSYCGILYDVYMDSLS